MATKRLDGKVAVITGSGRKKGLGEAIARKLALEGCKIVLSDIGSARDAATSAEHVGELSEMEQIAAELRALGAEVTMKACDVRVPAEVEALAAHAVSTFGGLDIWVNNAGIGYIMKPLLEVTEADWDAVLDVNLKGCFLGLQSAARRMIAAGKGGRIINIASQAAKSGFPHAQAYTSSKHGWAPGRMSISPRSWAQPMWRNISRRWPTAFRCAGLACPKTPPTRSHGSARTRPPTSPLKA